MTRALLLLLAGLAVATAAHAQEIYRWVDRDGVVHYADQPGAPDAKRIQYSGLKREPDDEAPSTPPDANAPAARPAAAQEEYQSLVVSSPTADQSFFGADAVVPVALDLQPPLQEGDYFAVMVDGKRVADKLQEPYTDLSGLPRGTHFVRAAVLSASGEQRIASANVTFHIRHPSIANPPVGPALRPPPKARP
jgi:hypothetical protein